MAMASLQGCKKGKSIYHAGRNVMLIPVFYADPACLLEQRTRIALLRSHPVLQGIKRWLPNRLQWHNSYLLRRVQNSAQQMFGKICHWYGNALGMNREWILPIIPALREGIAKPCCSSWFGLNALIHGGRMIHGMLPPYPYSSM